MSVLGRDPAGQPPVNDSRILVAFVSAWGKQKCLLSSGDRIVLIAGTNTAITTHNLIAVHEVE